jgi:hypothetical protein
VVEDLELKTRQVSICSRLSSASRQPSEGPSLVTRYFGQPFEKDLVTDSNQIATQSRRGVLVPLSCNKYRLEVILNRGFFQDLNIFLEYMSQDALSNAQWASGVRPPQGGMVKQLSAYSEFYN